MTSIIALFIWCVLGVNDKSIKIIEINKFIKLLYFLIGIACFIWMLVSIGNVIVDSIIVIGTVITIIKFRYFN